jgi:hypothetical protein
MVDRVPDGLRIEFEWSGHDARGPFRGRSRALSVEAGEDAEFAADVLAAGRSGAWVQWCEIAAEPRCTLAFVNSGQRPRPVHPFGEEFSGPFQREVFGPMNGPQAFWASSARPLRGLVTVTPSGEVTAHEWMVTDGRLIGLSDDGGAVVDSRGQIDVLAAGRSPRRLGTLEAMFRAAPCRGEAPPDGVSITVLGNALPLPELPSMPLGQQSVRLRAAEGGFCLERLGYLWSADEDRQSFVTLEAGQDGLVGDGLTCR